MYLCSVDTDVVDFVVLHCISGNRDINRSFVSTSTIDLSSEETAESSDSL